MARPRKTSFDYFPHDNDMRNHRKVKALRQKYKYGYTIYVMLIELLCGSENTSFPYTDLELELLEGDFMFSVTEIREVVEYCIKLNLFQLNTTSDPHCIECKSLNERLEGAKAKRELSRARAPQQNRENGKFATGYGSNSANDGDSEADSDSNTVSHGVSVTETPQSKVKYIDNYSTVSTTGNYPSSNTHIAEFLCVGKMGKGVKLWYLKNKTIMVDYIVPKMYKVWKEKFPDYDKEFFVQEVDFCALLNIAYHIGKRKGWMKAEVTSDKQHECIASWKKIVDFLATLPSEHFYRKLSIDGLSIPKNLQKLEMDMKAVGNGKPINGQAKDFASQHEIHKQKQTQLESQRISRNG